MSDCCQERYVRLRNSKERVDQRIDGKVQVGRLSSPSRVKKILPVDIAVVFAPCRKFGVQLDASKYSLATIDITNESNSPVHISGHIDDVADGNVAIAGRPARGQGRRRRQHRFRVVQDCSYGIRLGVIGDGGEGVWCQGLLGSLPREAVLRGREA